MKNCVLMASDFDIGFWLRVDSSTLSRVKFLIPITQRAADECKQKIVCVRAGRCGAAPPVFRLPDGLIF
jgi:hypothetical protein